MPRVTEEHRQAQRARIREAAIAVARRTGVAGLGMNDVIRESGMSAGAIYGYYKSKDELVRELARELSGQRIVEVEGLLGAAPLPHPFDVVRAVVDGAPKEVVEGGLVLEVWAGGARDEAFGEVARDRLGEFRAALARYLVAWLEQEGRSPEEASRLGPVAAPALLGLAQGYLVQSAVEGEQGAAAYVESLDALAAVLGIRSSSPAPGATG